MKDNLSIAVAVFGLFLNLGILVWGIAKMSAGIESLKETVNEFKTWFHEMRNRVDELNTRVSVLEDRGERAPADHPFGRRRYDEGPEA